MTIRVHNIDKWSLLPVGQGLTFPQGVTKVRLHLNTPAPTRVDVALGPDDFRFIGIVHGLETLEFNLEEKGADLVFTSEDEVWYYTHEGDETTFDNPEAVSFTKIAARRARNPQLEIMMFKAEQNMTRRLEALAAEYEARVEALGAHDPSTGEVHDEKPASDGDGTTRTDAGTASGAGTASDALKDAGTAATGGVSAGSTGTK